MRDVTSWDAYLPGMSSGYIGGPSRSAWEGATFWQRMNPATMSHVPCVRHGIGDDALAAYVEERDAGEFAPDYRTADKAKAQALTLAEIRYLKQWRTRKGKRRPHDEIPF